MRHSVWDYKMSNPINGLLIFLIIWVNCYVITYFFINKYLDS